MKLKTLLIAVCLFANTAAFAGKEGGGGDATEIGVDLIRSDILKWIEEGGPGNLKLWPHGVTDSSYTASMETYLAPHYVVVGFVTTNQENHTTDPEQKVIVKGARKSCRGFRSIKDGRPHILCNTERFPTGGADQYRLIHHEYAGLAGVEQNIGASSDYAISEQLTEFLVPEEVLRLAIKPGASNGAVAIPDCGTFNCPGDDPEIHHIQGTTGISVTDTTSLDSVVYVCAKQCKSGKVLGYATSDLTQALLANKYDAYSGTVIGITMRPGHQEGDPAYACVDIAGRRVDGMDLFSSMAFKGIRSMGSALLNKMGLTAGAGRDESCGNLPSDLYFFTSVGGGTLTGN